jgi:hypothetical protein
MEDKKLIKEEIALTEEGLKNKQVEKRKKELEIYKISRKVTEFELYLEKDILNGQIKETITLIKKDIESGKNKKGEELTPTEIEALKINLFLLEQDFKEDIPNRNLRTQLSELKGQLEFEKHNLSVIEKQIREKKVISIHR